jgi:hypothetical protein
MRLCLCADEKDDMASVDSDKFCSIINKVESLHQHGKRDCFLLARGNAIFMIWVELCVCCLSAEHTHSSLGL